MRKKKLNTSQLKKLNVDLINVIWKRCVILFLIIKNNPKQILFTLELVQKSKWTTFLDLEYIKSTNSKYVTYTSLSDIGSGINFKRKGNIYMRWR